MSRQNSIRPSVQRLVSSLNEDRYVALGDEVGWPPGLKINIPVDNSLAEATAIVKAAMRSPRLRLAKLRGTMVGSNPDRQTRLLRVIAAELPHSNLLCLNIGEFGYASHDAYSEFVDGLRLSSIGHLYWDTGRGTSPADDLIEEAKQILRDNRKSDFYRIEAVRDEVYQYLRHGCHAWWNMQPDRQIDGRNVRGVRSTSLRMLQDTQPTQRCRVACRLARCHGINKKRLRCCLCTRDPSRYCRHHAQKPYPYDI